MSRFFTYAQLLAGKVPEDFGVSKISGSSMTIPGQGSDLAQLIQSIVKLPPLDERTFDSPAGVPVDEREMMVKVDLDSMYEAEGAALAQEALERKNAAKAAKEAQETEKKPEGTEGAADAE